MQDEALEEDAGRKVRTLTMADGSVVREALVLSSQCSYTYTIVDRPNLKHYRSTIAVIPLDDSTCRIELIVHVGASEGESEEEVSARYTRSTRGNLKVMKRALGVP